MHSEKQDARLERLLASSSSAGPEHDLNTCRRLLEQKFIPWRFCIHHIEAVVVRLEESSLAWNNDCSNELLIGDLNRLLEMAQKDKSNISALAKEILFALLKVFD